MWKAINILLRILGLLLLVGIGFLGFSAFWMNREHDKPASKDEVAFVFSYGGLSDAQSYSVISSYESARSPLLGDGTSHHCIQIETFALEDETRGLWIFGADPNPAMNDARLFAAQMTEALRPCFGNDDAISADVAAYIHSVRFFRGRPSDAVVIFYHRPTNRLLYAEIAT